ncbi:MAG: hypothetical protein NZ960_02325 [Candidatus Kapabacteria bacterium]|nr:hypothetical protein [Candidatus Kapabacteria bacterium]MDW8011860.1 hypothetical protein [Bacteroidota bacterium]
MTPQTIILTELSATTTEEFFPFSSLHCLWELRWGPFQLYEWWQRLFPRARIAVAVPPERELWRRSFLARTPAVSEGGVVEPILVVNTQLLPLRRTFHTLAGIWRDMTAEHKIWAVLTEGVMAALWIDSPTLPDEVVGLGKGQWLPETAEWCQRIPHVEQSLPLLHSLWELIATLPEAFAEAESMLPLGVDLELWQRRGVWILAPERVAIAPTAELAPGVVIDARGGAVIIEDGVVCQPHAVLLGPCSIGQHSLLRAHVTIGACTAVGEHCRLGGEVAHSIFHGYANKQHEGFVGHSYVGEWVNLGAGTTTSNLKNTYGTVRVRLPVGERDTGMQFLGTLCGDHTKTAIGTCLRTGAVVGVCTNILSGGMEARLVPSFSWGDTCQPQPYAIEKALEVARRAMARRHRELFPEEVELLRREYERWWSETA